MNKTRSRNEEVVVHEYDGIQELDNELPRWWLYALFGTIVFAFGYWAYFENLSLGEHASAEYARIRAEQIAIEAERIKAAGEVNADMLVTLSKDKNTLAQGAQVFGQVCQTCHEAGGKGNIGPNLTDAYWIHGGEPMDIYKMIRDGYLPKQMPAWGKPLGEEKVRSAAAFVLSIRNTNVAGGKAPQGEKK